MTTRPRTAGLSNRAYARSRGSSEGAVRQARADGRLAGAILSDGTIDAAKADMLLSKAATSGASVPSDLSEARRRKLAAQCALLHDEVQQFVSSVVPRDDAIDFMTADCALVAERLYRLACEIAPSVARKPPAEASAFIQEAARDALTELSQTEGGGSAATAPVAYPLATMDRTELAALKATLQARRLEVQRDRVTGIVLDVSNIGERMIARFAAVRARVLGLHSKTAPQMSAATEQAATAILLREISDAVEQMACDLVPLAALLAKRPDAARHVRQRRSRGDR